MIVDTKSKKIFISKMRNIINGLIIVILVSNFGCKVESDYSASYKKATEAYLTYFPDSLLEHFPEGANSQFRIVSIFPERCPLYNRCGITLIMEQDAEIIIELKKAYGLNEFNKISFNGDCNLVVNKYDSIADCEIYLDSLVLCSDRLKPTPNFPRILNKSKTRITPSVIDINQFDIYIIEAIPGLFLDKENLSNGQCMPSDWKNGFSRGVAINETNNNVIYWLEIW